MVRRDRSPWLVHWVLTIRYDYFAFYTILYLASINSIGWRPVLVPCGHRFQLSGKREPNYRDYEQSHERHGRHSKELKHKTRSQRYDGDGTICFGDAIKCLQYLQNLMKDIPLHLFFSLYYYQSFFQPIFVSLVRSFNLIKDNSFSWNLFKKMNHYISQI